MPQECCGYQSSGEAELKPEAVRASGRGDKTGEDGGLPQPKAAAKVHDRLKVQQRNQLGQRHGERA